MFQSIPSYLFFSSKKLTSGLWMSGCSVRGGWVLCPLRDPTPSPSPTLLLTTGSFERSAEPWLDFYRRSRSSHMSTQRKHRHIFVKASGSGPWRAAAGQQPEIPSSFPSQPHPQPPCAFSRWKKRPLQDALHFRAHYGGCSQRLQEEEARSARCEAGSRGRQMCALGSILQPPLRRRINSRAP